MNKLEKPVKITEEEDKELLSFIGNCVYNNVNFPANTKFGVNRSLTVQEICTSQIETVQELAIKVKEVIKNFDPEFSKTPEPKIGAFAANKWINFFRLLIRKKRYEDYLSEVFKEKQRLSSIINSAKTVKEKRKEAEEALSKLEE